MHGPRNLYIVNWEVMVVAVFPTKFGTLGSVCFKHHCCGGDGTIGKASLRKTVRIGSRMYEVVCPLV